jgi:hypothetical protein
MILVERDDGMKAKELARCDTEAILEAKHIVGRQHNVDVAATAVEAGKALGAAEGERVAFFQAGILVQNLLFQSSIGRISFHICSALFEHKASLLIKQRE